MALSRSEARMIAQELHKLLRNDIDKAVTSQIEKETDRYIGVEEASAILGWSPSTIYKHTSELPCSRIGRRLRFSENGLREIVRRGGLNVGRL